MAWCICADSLAGRVDLPPTYSHNFVGSSSSWGRCPIFQCHYATTPFVRVHFPMYSGTIQRDRRYCPLRSVVHALPHRCISWRVAAGSQRLLCRGVFCIAYRYAGNLWFPIAIHFAWNFLLGTVLGLVVSGQSHLGGGWKMLNLYGPALFTGGAFGLEGGLIVTFTTITGIIAMLILVHQRHGRFRITQEAPGLPSSRHQKT
jgi:hypothetical protein